MPNEILKEIFELVLAINEEGKYQVFLDLSPHVDKIAAIIIKGEWVQGVTNISRDNVVEAYYRGSLHGKSKDLEAMRDRLYQLYLEEEV